MARFNAAPGRRASFRVLTAAVAALALVLTACTGAPAPTQSPVAPTAAPAKGLVIGATAEPATLDPTAAAAAAGSQALLYNVYETLVKLDANGEVQPLLAQAWDVTADRLTYTFRLHPAAKFSDGSPVDAEAVQKSIQRIKTGSFVPKYASPMKKVSATEVVDATTITVTLTSPSNTWLYDMAGAAGIVFNPAHFDSLGSETHGSGPFTLDRWLPGDSISLKRNTNYWANPARFDEVTFRYFKDPNAMNASMLSGQLDIISNLQAPETIGQFSDTARFNVIEGSTDGEVTMGINNGAPQADPQVPQGTGNPALRDARVRQALTMAIDRRALLDIVWNGKGTLIGSMAVPSDPYYEDLSGLYPYDPERAKALLAESGHSNLTLRLNPPTLPYATKAAQFIQSQLSAVGIKVEVQELQFPTQWSDTVMKNGDYDLTIVAHVEPRDVLTFANPAYYWRYATRSVQGPVRGAGPAASPEEYPAEMKVAARLIAEDAAAVWLFALPNLVVTKHGITGVAQNANSSLAFDVTTIARA